MSFEIITDSAANLTAQYVEKNKLNVLSLKYYIGENEYESFVKTHDERWLKEFYTLLRNKESVTTSCVNTSEFEALFGGFAEEGRDFIYLAFSSKLSATYEIGAEVLEKMKLKYPERKMYIVNTRAASMGQGLLVDYAVRQRDSGKTIDEVYQWQKENKLHLCHWFTVDDLFFLKRGGRINTATALAGTVLGIKPVLHVDNEGRLVNVTKARGRKQSLTMLVDMMEKTAINPGKQRVFIAHGDCEDDLKFVEKLVRDRFGTKEIETTYVNPVIGAHSGPGTIALFFFGTER